MRAAIVEREHVPALVHEEYRAMSAVHNKPPLGFQLLEAAARTKSEVVVSTGGSSDKCPRHHYSARALLECQSNLRYIPPADRTKGALCGAGSENASVSARNTLGTKFA